MAAGTIPEDRYGLGTVPLDAIQARAAEIRFGRTVLAAIAWVFYWAGWLAAKTMTVVVWRSFKFVTASVMVGWKEANGPSKRSIIESQKRVIAGQATRLSRFDG